MKKLLLIAAVLFTTGTYAQKEKHPRHASNAGKKLAAHKKAGAAAFSKTIAQRKAAPPAKQ